VGAPCQRAREHPGFVRMPWEERTLGGGKACRVQHAVVAVLHFVIAPIIPAVIRRKDDMLHDRASWLAIDPQEELGVRHAGLHIARVTRPRVVYL